MTLGEVVAESSTLCLRRTELAGHLIELVKNDADDEDGESTDNHSCYQLDYRASHLATVKMPCLCEIVLRLKSQE